MREESLARGHSDRTIEQAIMSIKKGAYLLKCGNRGKPKFCSFRLSMDEKYVMWYSGQEEKQLRLTSVTQIFWGQRNVKSQRQILPDRDCQSFSIIYENGAHSLDLICKDNAQAATWFTGLRAVISQSQNSRHFSSMRRNKEVQSCVHSPSGFIRRKHNLGLLEDNADLDQVRSLCGSPALSLSDRCYSDGLSYTTKSTYSTDSVMSNPQNVNRNSILYLPHFDSNHVNKKGREITNANYEKVAPNGFSVQASISSSIVNSNPLKDVMVWGKVLEGGGILGCGIILPRLLESTKMLDVECISLGGKHAAVVTKQGELFCWGQGKGGRLGHKVDMDFNSPRIVDSLCGIHVKYAACGEYHTCALTSSGEVYMWGDASCGTDLVSEERTKSQWIPRRLSTLDGVYVSIIACGEWHTAIASNCGRLFTFGEGLFGALGHGDLLTVAQPKEVESLKGLTVRSVSCGSWHTAAIVEVVVDCYKYNTLSGKLFTWGDGDHGKLGHADGMKKLLPTCVAQLVDYDFVQVSCGTILTTALTNLGRVFTMGSALHGQLGNPQAKDKSIAIVEGKLKPKFVKGISSGSNHVAVLTSDGIVYTWGKNANGQLGLGDTRDRHSPTVVEALMDRQVESIICGSCFTAAICLHKPISVIDQSSCSGCKSTFGLTRKKHNCYNCGLFFCHSCSCQKVTNAFLALNKTKASRVCNQCFNNRLRSDHSGMLIANGFCSIQQPWGSDILPKHEALFKAPDRHFQNLSDKNLYKKDGSVEKRESDGSQEARQNLENIPSLTGGILAMPPWGQVPRPMLFNVENLDVHMISAKMKQPYVTSTNLNSSISGIPHTDQNASRHDEMLIKELQKLKEQSRILEEQCELRSHKIQECSQKIDAAWAMAREEATKCKAAKDVIKALAARLHNLSDKGNGDKEVKQGRADTGLTPLTTILTGRSCPKDPIQILDSTPMPAEVKLQKDRNLEILSNSPFLFSASLKSKCGINTLSKSHQLADDSRLTGKESLEDISEVSKLQCVEQYEPGVYITLAVMPNGQIGLTRVRFSRKQFAEREAEIWWERNQVRVYEKYKIEGYTNSNEKSSSKE